MLWLYVLRLVFGWTWATLLIVAGMFLVHQRPAATAVPVGIAALCAAPGVFWAIVADPLCPRRARLVTRPIEILAAIGFVGSVAWSIWLVSTT